MCSILHGGSSDPDQRRLELLGHIAVSDNEKVKVKPKCKFHNAQPESLVLSTRSPDPLIQGIDFHSFLEFILATYSETVKQPVNYGTPHTHD